MDQETYFIVMNFQRFTFTFIFVTVLVLKNVLFSLRALLLATKPIGGYNLDLICIQCKGNRLL